LFPQRPQNFTFGVDFPPQRPQILSTCLLVPDAKLAGFITGLFTDTFAICFMFKPQRPQNLEN
jgi:hypothetical protein